MKKLSLILLIPAFLFASCVKEEVSQDVLGDQIEVKATVEEFGSETKAAVSDAGAFTWQSGDYITAYNENESIKSNGLSEGGSSNATFAFTGEWNADYNIAIYPGNVTLSEGILELPSQRTWKANDATPVMYATLENSTYDFMHVGGVVKVTVKNVPEEARKFVFYTPGFAINGEFALTNDNGVKSINTSETNNETLHSYTLTFSAMDITNPMVFYVPLPVGTYTNGFNFKLYDENNSEVGAAGGSTSQTVSRRALLKMPVVTLVGGTGEGATTTVTSADKVTDAMNISSNVKVTEVAPSEGTTASIELPKKDEGADETHRLTIESIADGTDIIEIKEDEDDTDGVSISELIVNVTSTEDVEKLVIDMPNTTVTIAANGASVTFETVEATTAENTLVVEDGVTINTLTVHAGNVKVQEGAIISSVSKGEGNNQTPYVILMSGAEAPETVGEGINVVSNGEYNLIYAVANSNEFTLTEDIELTQTIFIEKSEFTIDLNQKKLSISTGDKDVLRIMKDNAEVTITNGTLDNQNGENYVLSIRANNVTLNMDGVNIPANNYDGSLYKSGNYSGCTVDLSDCNFNGAVYLSNTDEKSANTLTVSNSTFTSAKQNCFELLNTNLTMSNSTLNNNVEDQTYQKNGNIGNNFSKPSGYCIAFTNIDGVAAIGSATLSNNTYEIADEDGDYIFNQMDGATLNMEVSRFNEFATVAAAGGEIKLLGNITNAEGLSINKNLVVDFNDHTYTLNKPGAGSTGTTTLGFQILQGQNVTFKNGTIKCSDDNADATWDANATEKGIAMMIQNYADLTLEDMTIDGTNIAHNGDNVRYIVSNNSGNVNFIGNTSITATGKDVAFDVCKYASYTAPEVTVNTTGTITGLVEVSGGTLNVTAGTFTNTKGHCVKVVNGTANFEGGNLTAQEVAVFNMAGAVNITNGTFTSNDNAVISGNGTDDDKYKNGTIEISGGTFNANIQTNGYVACGIYHPQKGTLKVTGGTFNIANGCGILMRGGTLDMTNSSATFNFTGENNTTGKVGDSRVVVPCGKKIVKDAYSAYYDAENIEITGVDSSDIADITASN